MWRIGLLTGKTCTFLAQNGSFPAFWHYTNNERLWRCLDVKWHNLLACVDASKKCFSTGVYSINRASEWLWLETQEAPQNGQMCTVSRLNANLPHCPCFTRLRGYRGGGVESKLSGKLSPTRICDSHSLLSETGRIRFQRARFQTPNSVSFLALTKFRGENSVSSPQPVVCVPKRTHRVFRSTHRVCCRTQ